MASITPELLQPIAVAIAVAAAAFALRALLLRQLRRAAASPGSGGTGALAWDARVPSLLWCLVVGAWAGLEAASLPAHLAGRLEILLQALVIATTTITAADLLAVGVARAADRTGLTVVMTGLARGVIRVAVIAVGSLVALGHLGVAIMPLLTALGVGGLAAALALQDTLSNLFAGFHLLADRPIRLGDLIRLENGVEGTVTDIGWRSTRVRTFSNNEVVVPNAKLAQSILTNYSVPTPETSVGVKVGVTYRCDPERVRRILEEEALGAVGKIPGLLADPRPSAALIPGFEDASLTFTLDCHIARFTDQWAVQDGLRRRILRRFTEEGVEMPGSAAADGRGPALARSP